MEIITAILAVISLATLAGAASIWFARGRGTETIKLLQINVDSYKDAEKLKDQKIAYLEGQLMIKDETIKRLLHDGTKARKRS
jgi:hypothetical protein